MRTIQVLKTFIAIAILCVSSTVLLCAQNPFAGTWKINVAKSKPSPGEVGELTLIFERVGDQWKQTGTGKYSDGRPLIHNYLRAWDGKDLPIDKPGFTLAITQVNDHTQSLVVKQDGKVVDTGRMVVSKDGKTMTAHHLNPNQIEVFDKQ